MSKTFLGVLSVLAMLSANSGTLCAAEPAPTEAELTLHPGDIITWKPSPPHKVRFGGPIERPAGTKLELTSFADVQKVLKDITPALTEDTKGIATTSASVTVKATVMEDTTPSHVTEFFFTCGFFPHSDRMVTRSFKIVPSSGQPPRNVEIVPANNPLRWLLKTPQGDRDLTRGP